jgi:hypothetical protein
MQIGVGATHMMQTIILSGSQPAPIESGEGHNGSPFFSPSLREKNI